jgi:apolipoprotein D and lipocalin family protein
MKTGLGVSLLALLAALFGCASIPRGLGPLAVVPTVDPQRYIGRWYEIARFQHGFEQDIVGATAEYSLNKNGTIAVVNSGSNETLPTQGEILRAVRGRLPHLRAR